MKVQTFLSSQELEHVKKESIKIFGRENVSGYLSTLVRIDMQASNIFVIPKDNVKIPLLNRDSPDYLDAIQPIPSRYKKTDRFKRTITKKKQLTTQELQAMADRLKG